MKFSHVLPLAALSTAFVLPPQEVIESIEIEQSHRGDGNGLYQEAVKEKDELVSGIKKHYSDVEQATHDVWDTAFQSASESVDWAQEKVYDASSGIGSWLSNEAEAYTSLFEDHDGPKHPPHDGDGHHGPPHDGDGHHGPPHDGDGHHGPPHDGDGHHGPPHHGPHHPHVKSNHTVYQLISESKYTTKLAKLINKYDDLVETLNSTEANYTVFAPTDKAFEKIPEHAPEPSKEVLKAILLYHVVDGFYPAGRVLATHTAPTLLKGEHLASEPKPQRVAFKIGLNGLTVNFYARIVAVNIFGVNGVIHGVDSLIIPPPNAITIVDLLPSEFSTFELGLGKTGLLEKLNTTDHNGGTLFAPSNFAFAKLGPKINAFLFSQIGLKYLKALLEYHVVYGNTLYSDAYYKSESSEKDHDRPSKGLFHVDLPTLLKDRSLSVDIAKYGAFISMRINAFSRVTVLDGIAEDGVIHVVSDVIVPPKQVGGLGAEDSGLEYWTGEEMTVEELKDRLTPLMPKGDL
ncbi:hypothetical protein LTR36_000407 [Oleoguttula mirabilis]|uniref:FAS1 domain-containing protein n=1 Tax=Oleoguttula mirabilis TaxID=1507867 RepID=A0AAV9JYP4_9PEZI|nr:hypothetical protein LTR36_000407 [Oleoguttula mirabilis]